MQDGRITYYCWIYISPRGDMACKEKLIDNNKRRRRRSILFLFTTRD